MYLVTQPNHPPFLTTHFDFENHWQEGMVVYHFMGNHHYYTTDGKNWQPVEFDSL